MAISKKKIREINHASFAVDALESIEPQFSRSGPDGDPWWDHPPESWERHERELWDLLHETERKLKAEIFRILGVENAE